MKMKQIVSKRRRIQFRSRGITQKKTYNIQNKAKVWNQELRGSQFPEDEDRDSPRNFGLLAIQPHDAAASLRIFYRWELRSSGMLPNYFTAEAGNHAYFMGFPIL
jgi:hypothetical protein